LTTLSAEVQRSLGGSANVTREYHAGGYSSEESIDDEHCEDLMGHHKPLGIDTLECEVDEQVADDT
jgi:hypothetical protein